MARFAGRDAFAASNGTAPLAAGVGVALIPRSAQPLRPPGLAVLPVAGAPASRLLFALVRAGTELDPGTRAALDALSAIAAARPDGIAAAATAGPASGNSDASRSTKVPA